VRVSIFGSCVTRDLFEDPALRPALVQYAARSSVVSAVADPVAVDEARVHLDSAFQRRCLLEDFNKTFFTNLHEAAPDWLVVDLIDERFNLLRTPGSFLTRSAGFDSAGLHHDLDLDVEELRRLTEDTMALLDGAIAAFAARIRAVVPPERVILHRAWWMTRYVRDGTLEAFPDERATFAERHNAALARAYDTFEQRLGGTAATVDLAGRGYAADAAHHWDLEPFHYEPAYNAAAVDRIRALTGL
jgi:uncharacterized protein DUF6270